MKSYEKFGYFIAGMVITLIITYGVYKAATIPWRGVNMKQYILKKENAYGNSKIATFVDIDDLRRYAKDNPLPRKYNYYMVIEEVTITRKKL